MFLKNDSPSILIKCINGKAFRRPSVIGYLFIAHNLNGKIHMDTLENAINSVIIFQFDAARIHVQHDGAPPHYNETMVRQWIS